MKRKLNELICRIFGHKEVEEPFAQRQYWGFGYINEDKLRYNVVHIRRCERCGKETTTILANGLTRAELLKRGWFFEK